jgi:hypothetical protein
VISPSADINKAILLFVKAGVDGAKAEADATKRAEKAAENFIV